MIFFVVLTKVDAVVLVVVGVVLIVVDVVVLLVLVGILTGWGASISMNGLQ
jgi:hypothetical protein